MTQKSWRRIRRFSLAGFGAVLLVVLGVAVAKEISWRSKAVACLHREKSLGLVCKLYASDHDGHFPKTLEDLVPFYISARSVFVCPFCPDEKMGYNYFGGKDTDDPTNILVESKTTFHDGLRAVVFVDCSGEIIADSELQQQLKRQMSHAAP